ncbi:MAG: hypothetical protein UDK36_02590 [Bacteroidaceae bacterium]|nr:hypothetical protein [Bacteroidaceae bacterium]
MPTSITLAEGRSESSRSHSADKFIKVSEIGHAIEIYVKLLSKM